MFTLPYINKIVIHGVWGRVGGGGGLRPQNIGGILKLQEYTESNYFGHKLSELI